VPLPQPLTPAPKADPGIEVTVVGTSTAKTAGSAHVLKAQQLERFEYDDPHAVVAQVPGVYSRGEDGVGLRPNIGLRGVNPDRSKKITLMEDGVLFGPAPYSAPAAYYFPLITRMSQVKVIKGPGSISFGPQTVGGALDMVTRRVPSFFSGGVDLALGQYGYGKAHAYAGNSDGKSGYVIEGIHLRDDGFKELPNGTDIGFHRNEWMWKGFYKFEPIRGHASQLQLKLTYADELSNETYVGLTDADFRRKPYMRYDATQLDRMQWFRTSAVASYQLELSDKASLTVDVYRHDLTRSWRKVNGFKDASLFEVLTNQSDPRNQFYYGLLSGQLSSSQDTLMVGPNQRDFVSQGVQAVVRWSPQTGSVSHRVEAGARFHYDRIRRRHSEDGYRLQEGQLVPAGLPTTVIAFNEATALANALHLTDAVTWKGLSVTPGVRVELIRTQYSNFIPNPQGTFDDNSRFQAAVLPGVGVYQALTNSVGLLAGVHRGFSPAVPEAANNTSPEKSVNYEGGARFAKGAAQAEVIGYYNDYQNLTDVCTLSSGCLDANIDRQVDAGKARIYGVEVYGRHEKRFGAYTVPVTLAYTATKAEFLRDFAAVDPIYGDVKKGDQLPYVPRHLLNAAVGVEHLRGGLNVSATYVSAMREQPGKLPLSQVLATDRQFVVDASAQARLYGPFVLYLNVRNIFNEAYIVSRRPFGARPNIPRWVQVGVRATF
jgi:Fe(3+) dicitrate transport protein